MSDRGRQLFKKYHRDDDESRSRSRSREKYEISLTQEEIDILNKSAGQNINPSLFSQANAKLTAILIKGFYTESKSGETADLYVKQKLSDLGLKTYSGNKNALAIVIDRAGKEGNVEDSVDRYLKISKEVGRPIGRTLSKTPAVEGLKYISQTFLPPKYNKNSLPFQKVTADMLIQAPTTNLAELAELAELADCINNVQPFPLSKLPEHIMDEIKATGQLKGTIKLVENFQNGFQVRDEIADIVERYEKIGAIADSQQQYTESQQESASKTAAEIPILFNIVCGAHRAIHSAYGLLANSKFYTIGYGYWGFTPEQSKVNSFFERLNLQDVIHYGNGGIYSADAVFDYGYENRIAGAWILKSGALEVIDKYLQESRNMWGQYEIIGNDPSNYEIIITKCILDSPINYSTLASVSISELRAQLKGEQISEQAFYEQVSANCVTFTKSIDVGNKINCSFLGFSTPSKCNTNPKTSDEKVINIIKAYQENEVEELLALLNTGYQGTGGKHRTKKRRKSGAKHKKSKKHNKTQKRRKSTLKKNRTKHRFFRRR